RARSMRRARCASAKPKTRNNGTGHSRWMPLVRSALYIALLGSAVLPGAAGAQALASYQVVGDGIPDSLTGSPGDAGRGRALILDRSSTCILCHSGPFPETKFQGDLAPNLAGSGSRWTTSQLRLRIVDASRLNPATIMPSYYRVDGLERVSPNFKSK